jgi:hypothetical protein
LNEFVKSILNYYAAFTETRFSSSSTLNYKWSNDPNFTLDISFFPEFRSRWLDKLSMNDESPLVKAWDGTLLKIDTFLLCGKTDLS